MQDEINPKPRKTAAERQRDCRDRKKSKGKYVNVFVPREVAKKIRGNPSLLVKRFVEFSVLMNRIEELEEELDRVTSHREVRKLRLRKRIENEFFWKLYEKTVEDLPEISPASARNSGSAWRNRKRGLPASRGGSLCSARLQKP